MRWVVPGTGVFQRLYQMFQCVPESRLLTHRMKSKLPAWCARLSLRSPCLLCPTYLPRLLPERRPSHPATPRGHQAAARFCRLTPAPPLPGALSAADHSRSSFQATRPKPHLHPGASLASQGAAAATPQLPHRVLLLHCSTHRRRGGRHVVALTGCAHPLTL